MRSTETQITTAIKDYILKDIMYEMSDVDLTNDFLLILDSMNMLQLQAFLEDEFNITINPEEVIPDNFKTVNNLTSFVIRKSKN